jgi:hypothetical protein
MFRRILLGVTVVWGLGICSSHAVDQLLLSLPNVTFENAGTIAGILEVDTLVPTNVSVSLVSDNPAKVHDGTAVIPAGTKRVSFSLFVVDDIRLDGVQTATVTARAEGYGNGTASVFIVDNEKKTLFLDLPEGVFEGDGLLTNSAMVSLAGTAVTDLHVLLQSSDTAEVVVPSSVKITAGHSNAVFNITAGDDDQVDGRQFATITASLPDFDSAAVSMEVGDNEFTGFTVSGPEGEMPGNVPLLTTVSAVNIDGEPVSSFSGAVQLSANSSTASSLSVVPAVVEVEDGQWKGGVAVAQSTDTDVHLQVADGAGHAAISTAFDLFTLNTRKMEADWELPYIYIIHREPDPYAWWRLYAGSRLLWYNTDFKAVEHVVDPGDYVTDMAVHYGDNRLYVNNHGSADTRVYDRITKEELDPLNLGTDVYHIKAGQPGCVYTAEYNWISYLHAFSTTNGAQFARSTSWVYPGIAETTTDGRYLYMCSTKSSSDKIVKYDITENTFNQVGGLFSESELNKMVVSMDGNYVFCNQAVYDSDFNEIRSIGSEIYAASAYGDLAVSETTVYNGLSGEEIYTLPFESTYMAFSGDQSQLVLFNATDGTLTNLSTADIQAIPSPSIMPTPEDGASVGVNLQGLSWSAEPIIIGYDLYFGTNAASVAGADRTGTQFIGRMADTEFTFPENYIAGGESYFWRVDAITYGDLVSTGSVWNFRTAAIMAVPNELNLTGIAAAYTQMVSVAINSADGSATAWAASCSNNWVILESTNGAAPGLLNIGIDMTGLPAGIHTTEILLHDGSTSVSLPVTVDIEPMQLVGMETDWALPYIYMLHTSSGVSSKSRLIWYNTDKERVELVQDAGTNATDLAVHYGDNRIYVSNFDYDETRVFNRTTKQETTPLMIGSNADRIAAGRTGRIYVLHNSTWDYVRGWNTETEETVDSESASGGDVACSPDGRYYYQNFSNTSPVYMRKFSVSDDAFEQVAAATVQYRTSNLLVSMDGSRVCNDGKIYDSAELDELLDLESEIYAISARGDLVVTETNICNGTDGHEVYTLPFASDAMAFSADQTKLVLYNPADGSLDALDMSGIAVLLSPSLIPVPGEGERVGANLQELAWSIDPSSIAYDVYLGTDSILVATAGTNDVAYLGRVEASGFQLPEGILSGGSSYYWRVDVVRYGSVFAGDVWRFETGTLTADPFSLAFYGVVADYTQHVAIAVESAVAGSLSWTASCSADWVILSQSAGTTDGMLDVGLDMSDLTAGEYAAEIRFDDGAGVVAVSVALTVMPLRIVKMEADWMSPFIYMLNTQEDYPYLSQLVWYNTDAGYVEHVEPTGERAEDLAVHYGENRIYVNNSYQSEVQVFDRSSKSALDPLVADANIDTICASLFGRVVTTGTGLYLRDSQTGSVLGGSSGYRAGGGACTLDGRTLFHSETGTSGASLNKFSVASNALEYIDGVKTKYTYGSDNVIVTLDGQRIYNCGTVYDGELNELLDLTDEIFAVSAYGDLLFTEDAVYSGVDGRELGTLPVSTEVMALSGDQTRLLLFDESAAALTSVDVSLIMPLPELAMMPEPADSSVQRATLENLSWSMAPGALYYDVYLGTDPNAVSVADASEVEYLGRCELPSLALISGQLTGSQSYYWRVDAVRFCDQVERGDVWSFRTASFAVVPNELSAVGMAAAYTQTVSMSVTGMVAETVGWTVSSTNDWIVFARTNGTTSGRFEVGLDMGRLTPGIHTANLVFSAGADTLVVPLTVDVEAMSVVKMVTDYEKPYIYMVHTSASSPYQSRLVWYNTDTEAVDQVRDAGLSADDLTVHYADDLIYINNAGTTKQVFDRRAKEALEPLVLADSQNGISAAATGQVVVENSSTYTRIGLRDTADGSELSYYYWVRQGDGECTSDGRFYYHVESDGSSSSDLFKFSIESNSISYVAETTTKGLGWGDYGIVVSLDGQRIYTHQLIFDAELNQLLDLGAEVHAASAYGDLVVAESAAYDGNTGAVVYTLPFTCSVMAFSGDQSSLVLFNPDTGSLTALRTADMMALPVPLMDIKTASAYATWKSTYFSNAAMAADADGDFDGQSNLDEYIAGTDPTSSESRFVLHDMVPQSDGRMVIGWDAVTGRVYQVYWTPSLGEEFLPLEPTVSYPQNSYTDRVERVEQSGFYRVGVEIESGL